MPTFMVGGRVGHKPIATESKCVANRLAHTALSGKANLTYKKAFV